MMLLQDLPGMAVEAAIQYFDVDRTTLLNESRIKGLVHHVDDLQGIVIAVDGDKSKLFKVPPSLAAWQQQIDGSYKVCWGVYRTQEKRQDGQHEWWDWKPQV